VALVATVRFGIDVDSFFAHAMVELNVRVAPTPGSR
jgi:hypothetical protein